MSVADEREKLLDYREQVVIELNRRSERQKKLEQELASRSHLLEESRRERSVLSGDTQLTLARESYRAMLRKAIARLKDEITQAVDEKARAEQRLVQVDEELAQLEEDETEKMLTDTEDS